jgi:hypothetical protein
MPIGEFIMNTSRIGWTVIGLGCIAIFTESVASTSAAVVRTVSPAAAENVDGNSFATPNANPLRIQHLIPAADFAGLPPNQRLLVAFNFRADKSQNQLVDWTSGDEQVWMSTTNKSSLTNVFEDNHGPDKTQVHNGAIPFRLLATGPANGPRDFADGPRLQTPFLYDPAQGNLLIDRLVFGNHPSPRASIDTYTAALNHVLINSDNPNSPTGALFTTPAVFQFEFVPEPTTFLIAAFACTGLLATRRVGRAPRN